MSQEKWENLNISRDEVNNIAAALKNDEFRSLLIDYVKETQNAEARAKYQQEIVQLEAERGVECTFVNPQPGFVVKTSQDGVKKAFINICSNDLILKPSSTPTTTEAGRGLNWTIPYSQSPPRDDYDKKNVRCIVYDVIFHPDTLYLAQNNIPFRNMVVDTAIKGVQDMFKVRLDQRNLKFPKLKYKGVAQPTVIRKKSLKPVVLTDDDREFHEKFQFPTSLPKESKPMVKMMGETVVEEYTEPKYQIKYRSDIDIQEFTFDKNSKMNAAKPKEIVLDINLPMLNNAKSLDLNISGKDLGLICETPAKYKLNLKLPYAVTDNGTAKFDVDKKILQVVLPVVRNLPKISDVVREDSGVESDTSENLVHELDDFPDSSPKLKKVEESFLESDQHYQIPSYDIRRHSKNHLAFTIWVKNVQPESVKLKNSSNGFQIKFISIGSGHFPIHYAFTGKFQANLTEDVIPDAFENSIILDVHLSSATEKDTFWVGLNEEELSSKRIVDFPICDEVFEENENEVEETGENLDNRDQLVREVSPGSSVGEDGSLSEDEESREEVAQVRSPKLRTVSEGSGDESTVRRSILKNRMNRSLSESCADEAGLGAGVLYTWSESCLSLQNDGEPREKKTVRFSQKIHCQTFRANSSILGQRRKNQKRLRNKKKSLERRISESENSEEGDEREKWVKQRPKITETVLKPVITKPTDKKLKETRPEGSKNDENQPEGSKMTGLGKKYQENNVTSNEKKCDSERKTKDLNENGSKVVFDEKNAKNNATSDGKTKGKGKKFKKGDVGIKPELITELD